MVLLVILMIFYYKDEDLEFFGLSNKKKAGKEEINNTESENTAETISETNSGMETK